MSKINKIVIHNSASSWGNSVAINNWHMARGWSGIGYHFTILNGHVRDNRYLELVNGFIETGRALDGDDILDPDEIGAHAYGFNRDSISICLIGNGGITDKQFDSLWYLLKELCQQYKLDLEMDVVGHYELDSRKTCPEFNVKHWISDRVTKDFLLNDLKSLPLESRMDRVEKKIKTIYKAIQHLPGIRDDKTN